MSVKIAANDNSQMFFPAVVELPDMQSGEPAQQKPAAVMPWDPVYHLRSDLAPDQRSQCETIYNRINKLEARMGIFAGITISGMVLGGASILRMAVSDITASSEKRINRGNPETVILSAVGSLGGLFMAIKSAYERVGLINTYRSLCMVPPPPMTAKAPQESPAPAPTETAKSDLKFL